MNHARMAERNPYQRATILPGVLFLRDRHGPVEGPIVNMVYVLLLHCMR